eukprot:CAMPEP_0172161626 /NCGR_PEP_ID=MMETSP1050-20130122/6228_1 /TAXON_ID=233186 /ORGANISM="Cryptomonas curvata, Strain CCAP979/52" /LENGTH=379 /DNA_ID=CAMNT_0012831541 /DNA_START=247 /DNA_END=1382 /DNA_ORIENTATION=+
MEEVKKCDEGESDRASSNEVASHHANGPDGPWLSGVSTVSIKAASWNIAAINNNPFEYWITNPDPAYNELMKGVQDFIENPECDLVIHSIFTDKMFAELQDEMQSQDISGLAELEQFWIDDYRQRMAIRGFLKDKTIGMKRLSSMPDRITNTINLHDGGRYTRPTAINSYNRGSLDSVDAWWVLWKEFMFHTSVEVSAGGRAPKGPELVCRLISSIPRSKYPAITLEEQAISIPLQILCLAILDAIFVHMLNVVQPRWEDVRRELCDALITNKAPSVCAIIARSYADMDVVFLQEAAAVFATHALATPALRAKYALLSPWDLDGKRDQNSLILADRRRFRAASSLDVTQRVIEHIGGKFLEAGDLLVASVEDEAGLRWL